MQLIKHDGPQRAYVLLCDRNEPMPDGSGKLAREVAKEAGFQFFKVVENVWATQSPRIALSMAAFASDELRAELLKLAKDARDPHKAYLTFKNDRFVLFTPKVGYWEWTPMIKGTERFRFEMKPEPHWWTTDVTAAFAVYQAGCARHDFVCAEDVRDRLKAKIERMSESIKASRATDAAVELPCPAGLAYYPFQKAGISFAASHHNTLFGDEMGLGKSIQAAGVVNILLAERYPEPDAVIPGVGDGADVPRVLVVCPASLKFNWKRELDKWLIRRLIVGIADSKWIPSAHVVIINYEALGGKAVPTGKYKTVKGVRKEVMERELRTKLREVEWDVLIVDESHRLKEEKTQRTKLTMQIRARRSLFLSGTPLPNRPRELWSTCHRMAPTIFDNKWKFLNRYCVGGSNGFGVNYDGAQHLDELQNLMRAHFMIRRLKRDVLKELPPKRRQIIELPSEGLQGVLAREQAALESGRKNRDALRLRVEMAKASDDPEEYKHAVAKLRQEQRIAFDQISKVRHETAVAKLPLVIEHLETVLEEQSKVIVFAHHRDVLQKLKAHFGSLAVMVYGDVSMVERDRAVQAFQNDPGISVFLGGIMAAGVGLTLTAAPIVVFAELDWVPGNVTQAEDRAHRIGQEADSVLIQHLVLDGSLDARMARLIVSKQDVADRALDNHTGFERVRMTEYVDEEPEELELPEKQEAVEWQKPSAPQRAVMLPEERAATHGISRDQIQEMAAQMTPARCHLVHRAIRQLAGQDADRAQVKNAVGFNKPDVALGHELAARAELTPMAGALGLFLCRKYNLTQLQGMLTDLYRLEEKAK